MQQDYGTVIKVRRRQISMAAYYKWIQSTNQPTVRGNVGAWSPGMSARLGAYLDNFRQDFTAFATLTYPDDYPTDGRIVKRHWHAFVERMRRIGWFGENSLVWFLEFQHRGAPHLHCFLTGYLSHEWVAQAWAEITGGNKEACSQVKALEHADRAGCYAKKYAIKNEQKQIPDGFINTGRWWGCCGQRILHGTPRIPCVVATTLFSLPRQFENTIGKLSVAFGLRMVRTERGYTIYGTEKGIKRAWDYLQECIAPTVLTDPRRDEYRQPW